MITAVLSVIFSGVKPQEAKAATSQDLDPENLTKEETTSGSDPRLDTFLEKIFSDNPVRPVFKSKELIKNLTTTAISTLRN